MDSLPPTSHTSSPPMTKYLFSHHNPFLSRFMGRRTEESRKKYSLVSHLDAPTNQNRKALQRFHALRYFKVLYHDE